MAVINLQRHRIRLSIVLFCIYMTLLPISTALAGMIGSVSVQNYIAAAYIVIAAIENVSDKHIRINKKFIFVYLYFIYTLISSIWNSGFKLDWYVIQFLITTLIIVSITLKQLSFQEAKWIIRSIYASALIAILVTIRNLSSAMNYRLTITLFSTMDSNDFACGLCVIVALCLTMIVHEKGRLINYFLIVAMFGISFLSGSRGALIMMLGMLLVWISQTDGSNKFKALFSVLLLALILFLFVENSLTGYLLERFTVGNLLDNGGSGRLKIWKSAISTFLSSNPLRMIFGYGHGGFKSAVHYIAIGHLSAYESHNMFINALIEGGIVGFVLIINCFSILIKHCISKHNIFGLILLIGFIIEGLTLDAQVYRVFAVVIAIAILWDNSFFQEDVEFGYE